MASSLIMAVLAFAAPTLAGQFPESMDGDKPDGIRHHIPFGHDQFVDVQSVKFPPKDALTEARNAVWCGLEIRDQSGGVNYRIAIGTGFSETVSCSGLREIGRIILPLWEKSFVAVYDVVSPNAGSRLAVVVGQRSGGHWVVDEAESVRLSTINPLDLGRIQRHLGK